MLASCTSAPGDASSRDEPEELRRLESIRARYSLPSALGAPTQSGLTISSPPDSSAPFALRDDASGTTLRVRLRDVVAVRSFRAGGYSIHPGAFGGADLIRHVHAGGIEDFVLFGVAPRERRLAYEVDVSEVAGLRLIDGVLEALGDDGTPRLRVMPPWVADASGARHPARIEVRGCAVDTSPAPPWGRAVTAPGRATCLVEVRWDAVEYPALVDPNWTVAGGLARPRGYHVAALLPSGRVLVAGGIGDGPSPGDRLASAEVWDPASKTFAATGAMTLDRVDHSATALATGKVLVVGGASHALNDEITAATEVYDPATGIFTASGSMSFARGQGHGATRLASGRVLVTGGAGPPAARTSAELFDPATGMFSTAGPLTTLRIQHTSTLLASGKVLIAGGRGVNPTPQALAELFDPSTGLFTATGAMVTPRLRQSATALTNGKVLVVGGGLGSDKSAELFDPSTGAFSSTGTTTTQRSSHTANLLGTGKVLVAAGDDSTGDPSGRAELYDPVSGTFGALGDLITARQFHTSTTIASGAAVVVIGGQAKLAVPLASAEVLSFRQAGAACATPNDCQSNVCEDGICCGGPCSGPCRTCSAGSGACAVVRGADDPGSCSGSMTCNAAGACTRKLGEACRPDEAGSCASGICADGVCCDTSCGGGCDSCKLPGVVGHCSLVPRGDPGSSPSCAPYVCDGTHQECPAACSSDSECVAGNPCNVAAHACVAGGTCDGDHTTVGANGSKLDCAPYKCIDGGGCRQTCASVDDCVAPTACDPTGHCVTAAPPSDSGTGCAASGSPRAPGSFGGALGLAFALVVLRRRRAGRERAARRA